MFSKCLTLQILNILFLSLLALIFAKRFLLVDGKEYKYKNMSILAEKMSSNHKSERQKAVKVSLSVERSLSDRLWSMRLQAQGEEAEREAGWLCQTLDISDLVARILVGRGLCRNSARAFINPTLKSLMPDPSCLQDMDKAVELIAQAIGQERKIAILGDYDVDGATSTALMIRYLRHWGVNPDFHIPDRLGEGYGPSRQAIDRFLAKGAELLITLDCGTMSHDVLSYAKEQGLTVIVIDHHLAGETLPPVDGVVNPNRQDDVSGLTMLAACGVTFLVLVALNRHMRQSVGGQRLPDLKNWLDLVALGTVADVVPLSGLNRAYVRQGLKVAGHPSCNLGLVALMQQARLQDKLKASHFGFVLGPRINAGGRIGRSDLGTSLLISDDIHEVEALAYQLEALNRERQTMEHQALEEAEAMVLSQSDHKQAAFLCVSSEDWHAGITGLIAARLKERYHKPAFALTRTQEGHYTGSARSVSAVNVGHLIQHLVSEGHALKGGGHPMAGGLSVSEASLADLPGAMMQWLQQHQLDQPVQPVLHLDGLLSARVMNEALIEEVESLAPFGTGFAEPVFAFPAHRVVFARPVGQQHLRVTLEDETGHRMEAMAFRCVGTPLGDCLAGRHNGALLHVAGTLSLNHWQGRTTPQVIIRDVALAG
jgi:single-stranded-DNA-specific exonuclease